MTNHIDLLNNTITVSLGDFTAIVLGFLAFLVFTMLFFLLALNTRKLLDRYRLKYSFDRELEFKEIDENKNSEERNRRIDRRERAFKKRVFKD